MKKLKAIVFWETQSSWASLGIIFGWNFTKYVLRIGSYNEARPLLDLSCWRSELITTVAIGFGFFLWYFVARKYLQSSDVGAESENCDR